MADVTFGPRVGRPRGAAAIAAPARRRPNADNNAGNSAGKNADHTDETRVPWRARIRAAVADTPRAALLLIGSGVALAPWLVYLAATLPTQAVAGHWNSLWTGLDTAEMAGLLATGLLARAGDPRRALTAAATATLLAVDAWFDCGSAVTSADHAAAYAMAVGAEIPLAVFLARLAWRAFPKGAAE